MRNIDADILSEVSRESFRMFFLLELQLTSGTYRYCDIDIPIYHEGELFSARTFEFDKLAGSANLAVESMDIDIDDADQTISAILLGEDVRNKTAILYFGVIAEGPPMEIKSQELTRGIIGGWELTEDSKASISITNEMVLWNKKPLRPQSASCPWAFKGGECQYAGAETWCDQSYARCAELANSVNFGGERFIPAIVEREVWWGRQRGA